MKRRSILSVMVLGGLAAGCSSIKSGVDRVTKAVTPSTAPKLHAAMRSLWRGHIDTTRDYARAVHAGDSGAAQRAETAVVDNAKQIASAVGGYYGQGAADGTLKLLAGHWQGVKALTDTARAKNAAGEQKAMDALAANASEIAKFFAGVNPKNWTVSGLQSALLAHAGHHKLQVDAMMANAPAAEQARLWTEMQKHMDMIADVLADGIAKQFPDKVS